MDQAGSGTPPGSPPGSSGVGSIGGGGSGSGASGSSSPGSSGTGASGSMFGLGSGIGATMERVNQREARTGQGGASADVVSLAPWAQPDTTIGEERPDFSAFQPERDLTSKSIPLWWFETAPARLTKLMAPRRRWDTSYMYSHPASAEDVLDQPVRVQFEVFLEEHRAELNGCLDGLTEEQARRSLVPSRTTLLGLVKHATFVEKVWFDEAITCRSRADIGLPATPDESFILDDDDTIATVQRAHREACAASRRATASLQLDDTVHGNRRGPVSLRWVYLHMLRELAQHCGHADILREQVITE